MQPRIKALLDRYQIQTWELTECQLSHTITFFSPEPVSWQFKAEFERLAGPWFVKYERLANDLVERLPTPSIGERILDARRWQTESLQSREDLSSWAFREDRHPQAVHGRLLPMALEEPKGLVADPGVDPEAEERD